jgi:septal ring factor EnvC (AmiA/AmiB activator)
MEKELSSIPKYKNTVTADVYFSPPIKGRITTAFDPSKRINGVMIHTGKKEVVQSISDGYILSIDKDSIGFKVCIQHKDGLVAIYSHLESVSKNTFDTVKKREGFATSKPSGIGFQMWYEGTAIDPQKFVAF